MSPVLKAYLSPARHQRSRPARRGRAHERLIRLVHHALLMELHPNQELGIFPQECYIFQ